MQFLEDLYAIVVFAWMLPNIRRLYPKLHIMIFSMQPADIYGEAVKKYGIEHYLSKTAGDEEMQQFLTRFLQNDAPEPRPLSNRENPFTALAPRELEILHYLLRGVGTNETSCFISSEHHLRI